MSDNRKNGANQFFKLVNARYESSTITAQGGEFSIGRTGEFSTGIDTAQAIQIALVGGDSPTSGLGLDNRNLNLTTFVFFR